MSTYHTGPVCGPRVAARSLPLVPEIDAFIESCFTDAQGVPVKQAAVHSELQRFLSAHSKALVELPRDHGKSFQVCCRVLWELARNPGLRVKIVCATDAVAAERSRFLRDTITQNALVRHAFPNLRGVNPRAASAFTIERTARTIGPSVAAFGVGAGSTGTRADLLICDDIVDVRAIHSKAERERAADYFTNNLMNLLEPDGRFWGLCTPWHSDDLNARLKKNGAYQVFRRNVGLDFEPVWPEKWPAERLRARQAEIGSASFARGYRLVPIADEETPIRAAWVRLWSGDPALDTILLSVDPAVSTSAKADRSALVVLGRTAAVGAPEVRVMACAARRVDAPDLMHLIDEFDRAWNPAIILFETNAAFLGIKDLLARHARFGPKLKSVTQSADKGARIAAFSVAVENGCFRLMGDRGAVDVGQSELFEEMTTFPFGEHDDLIDAAATGTAFLLDRRDPRIW
jgi:predicted phage terminase large subunit-like protein